MGIVDYSYDVGSLGAEEDIIITLTDSGYFSRFFTEDAVEFTPADTFQPEFRIRNVAGPDGEDLEVVYLSGYIYYQIGDTGIPMDIEWISDSYYQGCRLSGFPFAYYTVGGLQGHIAYLKTGNAEYGAKLEPPVKTDETYVRQVAQVGRNEIKVELFLTDTATVNLSIEYDQSAIQVLLDKELNPGWHDLTFVTQELERGHNYGFSMEYRNRGGRGTGAMTTGFYATR
jgi:hypothetical protein